MTATATTAVSSALATTVPVFTGPERLALAGFLAGYTDLTREAYALDLRQFAAAAASTTCACSAPAVLTSSASRAIWRPGSGPARQ